METQDAIDEYDSLRQVTQSKYMSRWSNAIYFCDGHRRDVYSAMDDHISKYHLYTDVAKDNTNVFAAGVYSYLCPDEEKFIGLEPPRKKEAVAEDKQRLDDASDDILGILKESNWKEKAQQSFREVGMIGSGLIGIFQSKKVAGDCIFKFFSPSDFEFCLDLEDNIERVHVVYWMTGSQIRKEFGEIPPKLKKELWNEKDNKPKPEYYSKKIKVLHTVFESEKKDKKVNPFGELWSVHETKEGLRDGPGYIGMPYILFEGERVPNEHWARGVADAAIQTIITNNRAVRTMIVGAEKRADPVTLVPDDGVSSYGFNNVAGGQEFFDPNVGKPEYMLIPSDTQVNKELVDYFEEIIRRAFYADVFLPLEDRKNMTATEYLDRIKHQLDKFTPLLGKLKSSLTKVIDRVYQIRLDNGKIKKPEGFDSYEIVFRSEISVSQESVTMRNLIQGLEILEQIAQYSPEVLDTFDFDQIARAIPEALSWNSKFIRSEKQVKDIQAKRAEQAEQERQAEMAKNLSDSASKMRSAA